LIRGLRGLDQVIKLSTYGGKCRGKLGIHKGGMRVNRNFFIFEIILCKEKYEILNNRMM